MNDSRRIVGLDTESWLIDRALVAPPLVCMQHTPEVSASLARTEASDPLGPVTGHILHLLLSPDAETARAIFEKWLKSDVILVLHNAAHDIACLIVHWPDLALAILEKLARGEVHCTVMRQKLLDCALGKLQDEGWTDEDYTLQAVAAGYGYAKDGADPWRLRYAELADVPVAAWPTEARAYAEHDPVGAVVVWLGQEECDRQWTAARGSSILYAGGGVGECSRRTEAAFDLHLAQAWGLRTHRARTERLKETTEAKIARWREELQAEGLVRILTDRGRALALSRRGLKAKPKDKAERDAVALISDASLLPLLTQVEIAAHLDPDPSMPKATKQARMLAATAANPAARKLTKTGEEKARERAQVLGRRLPKDLTEYLTEEERAQYISCDADAAVLSGDPVLIKACDYGSAGILLGGVEDLTEGYELPLQAGFDALKATGRTSSFKPGKKSPLKGKQLQNFDKDSGSRTCCIPRAGNGFIQVDMPGAELHAHAQNCMELFKHSRLAEELNAGIDPLLAFGLKSSRIDVPYAEAVKRKKEKQFKDARARSKPALYGFPGGMGNEKFVLYSRAQWDTIFSLDEAGALKREWLGHYDENPLYFEWVSTTERAHGGAIRQFRSERWRGGATYTAKCNGFFQGRCADAMLQALRAVIRETFDPRSPLFGFHLVNYVHDEIIMEGPLDRCSDAAKRLSHLALVNFNEWIDLVPIKAEKMEPTVMLCWSKDAVPLYDAYGNLLPWDLAPDTQAAA